MANPPPDARALAIRAEFWLRQLREGWHADTEAELAWRKRRWVQRRRSERQA